ncbi:C-type lectin lectoxin-Phi2-like isoform X1 [Ptychodera flava]|uniref:C-type lectin lectoxin-Phi2-like isoform X1 n=1 Tax=Ptychodera flava TaxID=63121 RepID=UPI00396A648E
MIFKTLSTLFAVLVVGLNLQQCQAQQRCPDLWIEWRDNCYRLYDCELEWTMAQAECTVASPLGNLVSIHSVDENDFVFSLQGGANDIWIGLNDRREKGTWEWTDGTAFDFHLWQPGEPNDSCGLFCDENCVEMQVTSEYADRWNDKDCTAKRRYMCKMPAVDPPLKGGN